MSFDPVRLQDPKLEKWLSGLLWEFEDSGASYGKTAELILQTVRQFCEKTGSFQLKDPKICLQELENS